MAVQFSVRHVTLTSSALGRDVHRDLNSMEMRGTGISLKVNRRRKENAILERT